MFVLMKPTGDLYSNGREYADIDAARKAANTAAKRAIAKITHFGNVTIDIVEKIPGRWTCRETVEAVK